MENINVFFVEDFPDNVKLFGDSKFKTPRCAEEKIPVMVLPECITNGTSAFKEKKYLHIAFDTHSVKKFETMQSWLDDLSEKPLHPLFHQLSESQYSMKIKVPDSFSVIGVDGSESASFSSYSGAKIRCAVEIPFVWENDVAIGITLQLVQVKILCPTKCLITPMDEDLSNNISYIPY